MALPPSNAPLAHVFGWRCEASSTVTMMKQTGAPRWARLGTVLEVVDQEESAGTKGGQGASFWSGLRNSSVGEEPQPRINHQRFVIFDPNRRGEAGTPPFFFYPCPPIRFKWWWGGPGGSWPNPHWEAVSE